MASEHDHNAVYNDDEDDDDEPLNDVVLDDDEDEEEDDDDVAVGDDDSSDADTNSTSSAVAVSVALPPPSNGSNSNLNPNPPPPPPAVRALFGSTAAPAAAVAPLAATPVSERKPVDDSRRLFQRLWTDEDEIELLQGFLDYTARRGPNWSGHHHDTTAFYDQIKSRIQLDCNKNQLVEKLRRLKKKYRTAVARIGSGKEFVFKTPHDQATFEISRKIWSNLIASRPEFDEDDQIPHPNSVTPVNLNLNIAGDHRTPGSFSIDMNSSDKTAMVMNMGTHIPRSRKRPRVKIEEEIPRNVNSIRYEAVNLAPVQGLMEENVKSSLSPLLKELVDNAIGGSGIGTGNWTGNGFGCVGGGGARGIGSLAFNAIPMNFPGVNSGNGGGVMEERWRKQQILELEVYSKRLELVQDQVKLALAELRTRN